MKPSENSPRPSGESRPVLETVFPPRPPVRLPESAPTLSSLLSDDLGGMITTPEAWTRRRRHWLQQWQACLGPFPTGKAPLKTEVLATEELPDFVRQRIRYQIEDGVTADAYLLTPRQRSEHFQRWSSFIRRRGPMPGKPQAWTRPFQN